MKPQDSQDSKVTPLSILGSALAGLLGVQKRANHERDFASGKFWHFFVAGALVTVVFILLVLLAVNLILYTA